MGAAQPTEVPPYNVQDELQATDVASRPDVSRITQLPYSVGSIRLLCFYINYIRTSSPLTSISKMRGNVERVSAIHTFPVSPFPRLA